VAFRVVEGAERREALAQAMGARLRRDLEADGLLPDAVEADAGRSYRRIASAPVLVALCLSMVDMDTYPDERRARNEVVLAVQSTAMAGQNFLLAAHDAGLAGCWLCAPCSRRTWSARCWLAGRLAAAGASDAWLPRRDAHQDAQTLEASVLWR